MGGRKGDGSIREKDGRSKGEEYRQTTTQVPPVACRHHSLSVRSTVDRDEERVGERDGREVLE